MKLNIFNGVAKPQETRISLTLEQVDDMVFVKMVDPTTGFRIETGYLLGFEVVNGRIQVNRCAQPNPEFVNVKNNVNGYSRIKVEN